MIAELFLEDLKRHINDRFPADQRLSFLESELFKHNTFAKMLRQTYLAKVLKERKKEKILIILILSSSHYLIISLSHSSGILFQ
jgi:hypothetical protein